VYAVTVAILNRQYSKRKQTLYIYGTSGKTHPVASTAVMPMFSVMRYGDFGRLFSGKVRRMRQKCGTYRDDHMQDRFDGVRVCSSWEI